MKVLIVVPTFLYSFRYPAYCGLTDMPIGLAYIASMLKTAGHEVHSCDLNNRPSYDNARAMVRTVLERSLKYWEPEVVMTGGICTDYDCIKEIIGVTRKHAPDAAVVIGGGIVTHDAQFIFDTLNPDFAIVGEGELVAVKLLEKLANRPRDYWTIPNLLWRSPRHIGDIQHSEGHLDLGNIDDLPFPDLDIFDLPPYPADRYLYRYPHDKPKPMVVVAGRSCTYRCSFCVHQVVIPYRTRSTPNVIAELRWRYQKAPYNTLVILDELFCPSKKRLVEFSQAMLQAKESLGWDVKWCIQTHCKARFDRESLKLAKAAGLYFFSYGMESAAPAVLESMEKKSTPELVLDGIKAARAEGVGFGGNFIFGDPAETPTTIKETFQYFRSHCRDLHMSLGGIQPYPGSKLLVTCLQNKTIKSKRRYYETIDRRRYNMTKMPTWQWLPWMSIIAWIGGSCLWMHYQRAQRSYVTFYNGTRVKTLMTRCPYCSAMSTSNEIIPEPTVNDTPMATGIMLMAGMIQRIKNRPFFMRLVFLASRVMGTKFPWWNEIRTVVTKGTRADNGVVTGCPNCNAAFRITV